MYECAYIKIQDLNKSLKQNIEALLQNENDYDDEYKYDELKQCIITRYIITRKLCIDYYNI